MDINVVRTDVVIIANSHNLSMINNKWITEKEFINEPLVQAINAPGMANYLSGSYNISATDQKMVFSTNKDKEENLQTIKKLVMDYIKENKYIEYTVMGLNFLVSVQNLQVFPQVTLLINQKKISDLITAKSLDYGGIIHAQMDNCILNLTIDKNNELLELKFNFHYTIHNREPKAILDFVEEINNRLEMAKSFSMSLLNGD